MDNVGDTFAFVQIHHGDDYATSWGNARANFYTDFGGYPTSYFDGAIKRAGAWDYSYYYDDYMARRAIPTNVTIDMVGEQVSGATYEITARVCMESAGSTTSMRFYMVQVLDYWPKTPTYHRNGFKQAASTYDFTLDPCECEDIVRDFTFDATSWGKQEDIKIIAWAQEPQNSSPPSDRAYVFQALSMGWPFPPPCEPTDDCDDGIACTLDECIEPEPFCTHTLQHELCDDSVECTDDTCNLCGCQNVPDHDSCSNSIFCDGAEICDTEFDCQPGTEPDCDDGVGCTDDMCNWDTDVCDNTPDNDYCDDSVGCTDDTCDVVDDCQFAPNDAYCDDSVVCTDDTCDAVEGCLSTPNDGNCDDDVGCTDDTCDAVDDCQNTINDANCDDSEPCTVDACDPGHELADPDGCVHEYQTDLFADVYPVPDGDGAVEGFDILCVLDQADGIDRPDCLNGDIFPCSGGDGAIEGFDILAVLDTANGVEPGPGTYVCPSPCP